MPNSQRRERSAAQLSEEYVTNWPAVAGAVLIVIVFVGGSALLYWQRSQDEALAHRQAANERRDRASRPRAWPDRQVAPAKVTTLVPKVSTPVEHGPELYRPVVRSAVRATASVKTTLRRMTAAAGRLDRHLDQMQRDIDQLTEVRRAEIKREDSLPILTEKEYLEDLRSNVHEFDFHTINKLTKSYQDEWINRRQPSARGSTGTQFDRGRQKRELVPDDSDPVLTRLLMLRDTPELRGIPFRSETNCVAEAEQAKVTQALSMKFRSGQSSITRLRISTSQSQYHVFEAQEKLATLTTKLAKAHGSAAVPVMVQMTQSEDDRFRHGLIDQLRATKGAEAEIALVQRAVFDLSPLVREDAIAALQERQSNQYHDALLKYMRYPWPPAANHAAVALVELDQSEATGKLADMLDEPDPRAPFETSAGKWSMREMVRVNHLKNCLLCHAPVTSRKGFVQAPIPWPNRSLPVVYYGSHRSRGPLVRADVTYLKQDFAVCQPVENHGKWPMMQRFDYFVRVRSCDKDERAVWTKKDPAESPYRKATLFALRKLTGKDVGSDSKAWRRLLNGG